MNKLSFLIALFVSANAFAVFEIGGNFAYDRNVYGDDRDNKKVTKTYSAFIAKYLFNLTAIEFNVSQSDTMITESPGTQVSETNYTITESVTNIRTKVWGVGLRQAMAPKKAFLIPTLSLGYARQIVESSGYFKLTNSTDGSVVRSDNTPYKDSYNSVYGTFSLKLRLTKYFSITASATTVFPAFEFDKARDDVKYTGGFSWMF